MIEPKFRAWNGAMMRFTSTDGEPEFCVMDGSAYTLFDGESCFPRKRDWPLMQYTGLKDKNGAEIYEGDIVIAETGVAGSIVFHNGAWCWTDGACHWLLIPAASAQHSVEDVIAEDGGGEVIGNIHENPDLLTA